MTRQPQQNVPLAALLMCGATLSFATLDSVLKAMVVQHSAGMLVTVRIAVQIAIMLALTPWFGRRVLYVRRPLVQVGRGLCLVAGTALAALSLRFLPMAQTYAIGFSAPLIAALVAAVLLREALNWRQLACILGGFAGVVLALDPGAPSFGPALVFPLALAGANAGLHVLTRIGRDEDPLAGVLWSAVAAFGASLLALPWTFEPLDLPSFGLILFGGAAGTLGQLLMFEAFRRAPTAVVSPFVYAQFVWTAISGALLFGEQPGLGVIIGAIAVAVSGVALVRWATPRA